MPVKAKPNLISQLN